VRSAAALSLHTKSVHDSSSGELGRDGEGCNGDDAVNSGEVEDVEDSGNGAATEGVCVGDSGGGEEEVLLLVHGPQNTAVPHASHAMGHRQASESALQRTICHRRRGDTPFSRGRPRGRTCARVRLVGAQTTRV
jgi:hypothetical protein